MEEEQYLSANAGDRAGRVFELDGRILRRVQNEDKENIEELFRSGLIEELIHNNMIPKTWIHQGKTDCGGLIIESERIEYVTYPYEWSFNMVKAAALLILEINRIALKYGYELTDPHPYNVVFCGTIPQYVDLGSYAKICSDVGVWQGSLEFYSSYYYPLYLWSAKGKLPNIAQRVLGVTMGRIPTGELMQITHKWMPKFITSRWHLVQKLDRKIRYIYYRNNLPGLIKSLQHENRRLYDKSQSFVTRDNGRWSTYQADYLDENSPNNERFRKICGILREYAQEINSSVELAGNMGVFSNILLKEGLVKRAVVTDYDRGAIDRCFELNRNRSNLFPAVIDIVDCMEPGMVNRQDRLRADLVIALAVCHHLILAQHIDLQFLVYRFSQYTKKYLLVEYMPYGLWNKETAKEHLPQWYTIEWFREKVRERFEILLEEELAENRVVLLCELKRK